MGLGRSSLYGAVRRRYGETGGGRGASGVAGGRWLRPACDAAVRDRWPIRSGSHIRPPTVCGHRRL